MSKLFVVITGEENLHVIDAFLDSSIEYIIVGHAQGAAFMTGVYGRLTKRACIFLTTLRLGEINLIMGFAAANLDRVPK